MLFFFLDMRALSQNRVVTRDGINLQFSLNRVIVTR